MIDTGNQLLIEAIHQGNEEGVFQNDNILLQSTYEHEGKIV